MAEKGPGTATKELLQGRTQCPTRFPARSESLPHSRQNPALFEGSWPLEARALKYFQDSLRQTSAHSQCLKRAQGKSRESVLLPNLAGSVQNPIAEPGLSASGAELRRRGGAMESLRIRGWGQGSGSGTLEPRNRTTSGRVRFGGGADAKGAGPERPGTRTDLGRGDEERD